MHVRERLTGAGTASGSAPTSFAPPAPPQSPGPAKNVPTGATETAKETEEGDLSPNNDRAEPELANEKVAEGIQQAFI